jgi:hypothetical protein
MEEKVTVLKVPRKEHPPKNKEWSAKNIVYPRPDLKISKGMTEVTGAPNTKLEEPGMEASGDSGPEPRMRASANYLSSSAYCGCLALVAEYILSGYEPQSVYKSYFQFIPEPPLIVGVLGHYTPDFWAWLCHDFRSWHKFLREKGYLLTRVYVFEKEKEKDKEPAVAGAPVDKDKSKEIKAAAEFAEYVKECKAELKTIVGDPDLVTFSTYTGNKLKLRYRVRSRRFDFEEPGFFRPRTPSLKRVTAPKIG